MAMSISTWLQYLAFVLFTVFHCNAQTQPQQEPNYLRFVFNASEMPLEDSYDYIIVGGGTAGCPLAATLSTMFRVLVLERGGVGFGRPNLMTQEGFLNGFSLDHKLGTKIGGSTFDPVGKRHSAADLLTLARATSGFTISFL